MNDPRRRRQFRPVATALLGLLLPLTLTSTAQTPAPAVRALAAHTGPMAITQPATWRPAPAAAATTPLPGTFNVRLFEAMARQLTTGGRVPGMAMAIVHDGRVVSAGGYGVTDVSHPQPVDAHTPFRLASLSKAFAGTLTGLLVNDGLLRWDSKVTDFVPGFRLSSAQATERLTVADVVSQRSGLPSNAYDHDIEANADYYTVSRKLASTPLRCQPGSCYSYQNVAFSLIGDVAYAATGSFYEQLVERRLFKPLGMNDASLGLAGLESSPRWARPHVRGRNGWVALRPKPTYYRLPPAAGVNASASDMALWLNAQLGHRPDVLPAPLLATLHAPLITTPAEMRGSWRRVRVKSAGYGIGWRVLDYSGHPVIFHAGAVQGYRGLVALVPEHDLGIAILWNGESTLPSGLLPTMLDRAFELPTQRWLDIDVDDDFGDDNLLAERAIPASGVSASHAKAAPH